MKLYPWRRRSRDVPAEAFIGMTMSKLSFSDFLNTSPGILLKEWEKERFDALVSDAFGFDALQVGGIEIDALEANRIPNKWRLFEKTPLEMECTEGSFVQGLSEELPFDSDSMDLVVLPHTIDMSREPQKVLREAVRVLRPEGRIVCASFNSMGAWWMKQKFVALGLPPYLPSQVVPVPLHQMKDWMQLLGLEIDSGFFGVYQPAFRRLSRLRRWSWINKAGDRWAPQFSNLVVLSAVKRVGRPTQLENKALDKLAEAIRQKNSVPLTQKTENN